MAFACCSEAYILHRLLYVPAQGYLSISMKHAFELFVREVLTRKEYTV